MDSDDADFANDAVVSRRCLGAACSDVGGGVGYCNGVRNAKQATPEKRFNVIFTAAEVAMRS